MPNVGQSEDNKDKFYYNWGLIVEDEMWNIGTESAPVRTEYDPCPTGWRVPTYAELDKLQNNKSSWTTSDSQKGYYFSGDYTYLEGAPQVFFPAAGDRGGNDGGAYFRGGYGNYWSSRAYDGSASSLYFNSRNAGMNNGGRAEGYSVRCVQVTD